MRRIFIICILFTSLMAQAAFAAEVRVIELIDGNTITGEVESLSNGIYTIRSPSLGAVKIEENKIRAIRAQSATGQTGTVGNSATGELNTVQQKMMGDKEVMGLIQSLQNDPEFQKILEDPEIIKAVSANDMAALMANPKFMKLLSNPTVQDISKKVK